MGRAGDSGLRDFQVVGRGGFSVVYQARQVSLDRLVAVKLLLADLSDESEIRRFRRECAALGQLDRHRHIVEVYDAGVVHRLLVRVGILCSPSHCARLGIQASVPFWVKCPNGVLQPQGTVECEVSDV